MGADVTAHSSVHRPWLTIWFSPRITIRRIVEAEVNVRPTWVPVLVLALPVHFLSFMQANESDPKTAGFPISDSLLVVIKGQFFLLVVAPVFLAYVGRWLGGRAGASRIFLALVWCLLPVAVTSALWIPTLLVFGHRVLTEALTGPLPAVTIFVTDVCSAWSLVLLVGMLAEVQRFSLDRAFIGLIALFILLVLYWAVTIQIERFVGLR